MAADKLGYFATTSPAEGDWSFPVFCPDGELIVASGYDCIDYLVLFFDRVDRAVVLLRIPSDQNFWRCQLDAAAIHPEKYTTFDPPGIPNLQPLGSEGTWVDCGEAV